MQAMEKAVANADAAVMQMRAFRMSDLMMAPRLFSFDVSIMSSGLWFLLRNNGRRRVLRLRRCSGVTMSFWKR